MPSFDTVCEANLVEVKNAVENTAKEIATRFDFKGTSASIEIKDKDITLIGDADFQLTQAKLAQMATQIDSAALLTYRAAWLRDQGENVTREAAMAKMVATENAQQVIDRALQMFGGAGVVSGMPVETLYRESEGR